MVMTLCIYTATKKTIQERGNNMKIGIIGAMEEEVEILKDKMGEYQEKNIAGSIFYTGYINGKEIVLLKSGIGKVNAAMGTTLMIQLYQPDYIINTGSAGGFKSDLKIGDIVISNELRYHDVDATVFGYEFGQVPGMPANYRPDGRLIKVAEQAATNMDINVVTGLITSSDSFMDNIDRVNAVREQFPTVYAAEMEATAIAQVCAQFDIPFVIIRSLSDIAGDETKVSYDQFLKTASLNSANLVLLMVKEMDNIDK